MSVINIFPARFSKHKSSACSSENLSREQGWRSGESARLPPVCPRFDSHTWRHHNIYKWAEFVGSLLCSERFFSGYSGFPLDLLKNQHLVSFTVYLIYSLPNLQCTRVRLER